MTRFRSKRQRVAFTLRAEDRDYEEIAHTLGSSADNARKLVQSARRRLKAQPAPLLDAAR